MIWHSVFCFVRFLSCIYKARLSIQAESMKPGFELQKQIEYAIEHLAILINTSLAGSGRFRPYGTVF